MANPESSAVVIHRRSESNMSTSKPPSDGYKEAFHKIFPDLVKELTEDDLKNTQIADGIQHLKEVRIIQM